eukprot:gene669-724_t
MEALQSLVFEGRLILHNLYRIGSLNESETALVRGKVTDNFPDIIPNAPWDGRGLLPNCNKSLVNGDEVPNDLWKSLRVWHAGLSCQLLKPKEGILFDVEDPEFLNEFKAPARAQNQKIGTDFFRIFQMYELEKGSSIPPNIGIEIDGDNHVCLYPTGADISLSDIEVGQAAFTIDALSALQPAWKPYAIFQVRTSGFNWPETFPLDSHLFPFRQWVSLVINFSESTAVAINAARDTENYCSGDLTFPEYSSRMLSIARSFSMDCSYDHIDMNCSILKALQLMLDTELART